MLVDIVDVKVLDGHRLRIRFQDGIEGEIDLDKLVRWEGVFEPLRDRARFAEVRVVPELGTVCWPNGADLDPDVLYSAVSGQPIELQQPIVRR
jgi:hypothetical protein